MQLVVMVFAAVLLVLVMAGCDNGRSDSASVSQQAVEKRLPSVAQVPVPEGKFIRGSNRPDDPAMRQQYGFPAPLFLDEHPQATIFLDGFMIDTYEVSNAQYKEYVVQTGHMLPFAWMNNGYGLDHENLQSLETDKLRTLAVDNFQLDIDARKMDKPTLIAAMLAQQKQADKLPVSNVNWFAAKEFCEWRNSRLPTEAEWEKAARGPSGLEYPWGNQWDPKITNTGDDGEWEDGIAPVGSYPDNISPYGVYDMSGNVWEWVADWYQPYENSHYESAAFGKTRRVLRGGGGGEGHYAISYFFRGATRQFSEPEMESEDVGFRCVSELD
ncbi:MAG: formylglycine-generating enzyme family protein [Gammaproteobacteria bacterium]|nr:formylglycine-generating enzyme family protein [Gammaproteobacteria bacterium]